MNRYLGSSKLRFQLKTWTAATGLAISAFSGTSAYAADRPDRTVNCPNYPSTFPTINGAIAASIPGDIIWVCPGIYPENVVVSVNNLTLVAKPTGAAKVVPGDPALPGFQFTSNGSTVDGFAISGFNAISSGVFLGGPFGNNTLVNNTIFGNTTGITVNNSLNNTITANFIGGNSSDGINDFFGANLLSGQGGNLYLKNSVKYNGSHGIVINTNTLPLTTPQPHFFYRARIESNTFNNNRTSGALLNFSSNVLVKNNELSFNGEDGIELIGSSHNRIIDNEANQNGASETVCGPSPGPGNCTGIRLHSTSTDNKLDHNRAKGNLVFDAQDNSTGSETAGTANTWTDNVCKKDSPEGLCESR